MDTTNASELGVDCLPFPILPSGEYFTPKQQLNVNKSSQFQITALQWVIPWYGAGKTSKDSVLNIPGKVAWISMEVWGMISLLYMMYTVSAQEGIAKLPWENKAMAGMFITHYLYRSIIAPLLNPSMAPIHLFVWLGAFFFQVFNGLSIGGWLGGYGPQTRADWHPLLNYKFGARMELGMMIWALGFAANIFHDDELREIRRSAARAQKKQEQEKDEKAKGGSGVEKLYMIPQNGLFELILYPHYLCEWIEWGGFYLMAGSGCVPARNFLINEITTMFPRALQGKKWYIERFGKEKVGAKKAIIPYVC
jgi:3-oxo-5-alpha-steroid 4-dehydrogenase 1